MTISHETSGFESKTRDTVRTLFSFIEAQGQSDYIGEAVSQLEHSLQAAARAKDAGADSETILAALLHDIGRFIPSAGDMPKMIAPDGTYVGNEAHEIMGEKYLRSIGFSDKICQIVGAHVWAKRYLTATEEGYWEALSNSSKATLEFQGGRFNKDQIQEAEKDPLLQQKLAVRRWDDQAKVPGANVPSLDAYEEMAVQSLLATNSIITLHSRRYHLPKTTTVVICVDGFDPAYLKQGIVDGILPTLKTFLKTGFRTTATVSMPTFTNTNNVSIITGAPPSIHGISGNYFLDRSTGEEKMITDASLLHGSTILAEMSKRGVHVAAITAKDKLRKILAHGLEGGVCFSAEKASPEIQKWIGKPAPDQYSGELSLFVLDAGIKLVEDQKAELLYLTLSDYIQHKYAPGESESNHFLAELDSRIGRLVQLGANVAVTGDHGMNDKCNIDGTPNVLFLQDELEKSFGTGCARVICPITDPFVRHHGALGSFVRVYIGPGNIDKAGKMLDICRSFPQVDVALTGSEAAARFELPVDIEGDIVVAAVRDAVIGSKASEHDLTNLKGHRLRSHGGLTEQHVPLLFSNQLSNPTAMKARAWRNYDIFELALSMC